MSGTVTAKGLREKRHALIQQARKEILEKAEAENREMSADEQAAWERVMGGVRPDGTAVKGEVDALADRIARLEQLENLEAENARLTERAEATRTAITSVPPGAGAGRDGAVEELGGIEEARTLALQGWLRYQMGQDLSERQQRACEAVGLRPHAKALDVQLYDTKALNDLSRRMRAVHPTRLGEVGESYRAALSPAVGSAGAYLIPPETLVRNLEVNLLYFGGVRQVAETLVTASGEDMTWPTANDTGNKGRRIGASTAVGTGGQPATTGANDPTFAKVKWGAYKYTSDAILVPYELLQDSAFNLPEILGQMLGERIGRITNDEYTTGTGAVMPVGIVAAAGAFAAAGATAITGDDVLGLFHSVDPAYRSEPGVGFMCHDNVVLALRKLKDGQQRYLWQDGLQTNTPDKLLGQAITVNQSMDSTIASGKKTLLWGSLRRYKIRRVQGLRLYRLEERYRDNDQDGFVAFTREDGNLLQAGTAPVKVLTQP